MKTGSLLMMFRAEAVRAHAARRAGLPFDPKHGAALLGQVLAQFDAAGLGQAAGWDAVREVCNEVAKGAGQ